MELRILRKAIDIPAPIFGAGVTERRVVEALQFRVQQLVRGHNRGGYYWTEWQDVPVVEDDRGDR